MFSFGTKIALHVKFLKKRDYIYVFLQEAFSNSCDVANPNLRAFQSGFIEAFNSLKTAAQTCQARVQSQT